MSGLIACTLAPASTLMVTAGFCAQACTATIRNHTTYPYTRLCRDMRSLLTMRGVHLSAGPLVSFCTRAMRHLLAWGLSKALILTSTGVDRLAPPGMTASTHRPPYLDAYRAMGSECQRRLSTNRTV